MSPGATAREVTAAFRRFALRHHPDRGGDPERFRLGAEAYRRLLSSATGGGAPARPRADTGLRPRVDIVFHRRRRSPLATLLRRALHPARPRS